MTGSHQKNFIPLGGGVFPSCNGMANCSWLDVRSKSLSLWQELFFSFAGYDGSVLLNGLNRWLCIVGAFYFASLTSEIRKILAFRFVGEQLIIPTKREVSGSHLWPLLFLITLRCRGRCGGVGNCLLHRYLEVRYRMRGRFIIRDVYLVFFYCSFGRDEAFTYVLKSPQYCVP